MPECHRCKFNGKGDPRCLTCKGPPEVNNKGRYVVSMDSAESGRQSCGEVAATCKRIGTGRSFVPSPELDLALKVVYVFAELTPIEFDMVRLLFGGATQSDIARARGLTRQAISLAMRKLVKKHPVFGALRSHALTKRTIVGKGRKHT